MRRNLWVLLFAALPLALHADAGRLKNAEAVLTEMAGSVDTGIPRNLLTKAKCVVIVPGVKKGAIGVGGQYGRGYMSCRTDPSDAAPPTPSHWTAPAAIRIEGGSIGLQIGGTDTDVILLVMNDRGVERLMASKFTVGAEAAVAAGPVGRQANASTDATMMAEILSWSHARGAFAGVSLQGSTLREDASENKLLYGKDITNKEIIKSNVPPPAAAESFLKTLSKF